jgi:ketosteroid isomerase-like protein
MVSARLFGSTPWSWRGFWSRGISARANQARVHAGAGGGGGGNGGGGGGADPDRTAILEHVRGIFAAYLARDREAIRRAHTDDWTGFHVGSQAIERGLAAYMRGADHSLATFRATGFEITDHELQVRGDTALLYYTARYDYRDAAGTAGSLYLRSLDVYRREPDGAWNQAGSHITIVPPAPAPAPGPAPAAD